MLRKKFRIYFFEKFKNKIECFDVKKQTNCYFVVITITKSILYRKSNFEHKKFTN